MWGGVWHWRCCLLSSVCFGHLKHLIGGMGGWVSCLCLKFEGVSDIMGSVIVIAGMRPWGRAAMTKKRARSKSYGAVLAAYRRFHFN